MKLSRRTILRSLMFAPISIGANGFAMAQTINSPLARIVTIGLPATDLVSSLGVVPIGAAPAKNYRSDASDTVLPDTVVDVGQAFEPNFELLEALRPDLIVVGWPIGDGDSLHTVARVLSVPIAGYGTDWYSRVSEAVGKIGRALGREAEATRAVATADGVLEAAKLRLKPQSIYLVNLDQDGLNIRIYGRHSLADSVMRRIGVSNAFSGDDNMWGWKVVGLETFFAQPEAPIVHLPLYFEGASLNKKRLMTSPLWRALPQVKAGRVFSLSPIDIFGGFNSATRFASSIAEVLGEGKA